MPMEQQPSDGTVTGTSHGTAERAAHWMAGSMLSFDLAHEVRQLQEEEHWRQAGRNAKTLVKEANLRVVLMALRRGARGAVAAT